MVGKDFYLTIDGRRVRVSEEVYKEYRRAEDKERYFMRTLKKGREAFWRFAELVLEYK